MFFDYHRYSGLAAVAMAMTPEPEAESHAPAPAPVPQPAPTSVHAAPVTYPARAAAPVASSSPPAPPRAIPAISDADRWKAEFESSAEIRAEFGELSTYQAFRRAEKGGRARIHSHARHNPLPSATASVPVPPVSDADRWKAEFDSSAEIRAEFGELGTYQAFRRAEKGGRARVLRGGSAAGASRG